LGIVAITPFLVGLITGLLGFQLLGGSQSGLLLISSAGLLIVVGVIRDTYRNIEAELKLRGYDYFVSGCVGRV
jgi:preprotein translocase subunit SecY